jgi:hypothetical protein
MEDSFSDITIFKEITTLKNFLENHSEDVINTIDFDDSNTLIQHRSENKDQQTMLYGNLETHNVSIAIASAITAYARIHMSQFKNNPDFNLYYSDTDSIYIDKALPDDLVNSKVLGLMKLEYGLTDAIFIAPKVYYLETEDGKVIYKVKSLKHEIELTKNDFESLLVEKSFLEKIQTK